MNLIAAEQIIRAYANANGVSYNEEVLLRKCKEYADHEDWNPYFVEFAYRLAGVGADDLFCCDEVHGKLLSLFSLPS